METTNMKGAVEYIPLPASELNHKLFCNFRRRQVVTKCWKQSANGLCIVDEPDVVDWSDGDYEKLIDRLKNTLRTGGAVYGAFVYGELKGFAAVEGTPEGSRRQYAELSAIYVSEDARNHGVGTKLFELAKAYAKKIGAGKLYISGHCSVESQAFCRAMGCVEADEYGDLPIAADPRDLQLECRV